MSDQKIIAGIRARDPAAISAAMERYAKLLWSVAAPILRKASVQDVEECVADVFIDLWQNPEKFDPERGSLKTWLSIRARSQAIDRCRAMAKKSSVPLEDIWQLPDDDTQEAFLRAEDEQVLSAAVDALPEPEREILVRRYYLDQKPRDIAQIMGMPTKAVENRLYRAKQKLRKQLEKNGGFYEFL